VVEGLSGRKGFDLVRDLLVVVDEVALDPGRAGFRPGGSAGGHNGLKSVERRSARASTRGSGSASARRRRGADLADWVLSRPTGSRSSRDHPPGPRG
jgi:peptidyl-tRNA hydrolase